MRTVDLAIFSDAVSARTAAVEARLERARDRIRQASIEREARRGLPPATVELLEESGALGSADVRADRQEIGELAASLAALRELQGWIEERLDDAHAAAGLVPEEGGAPESFEPPRAA